MCTVLIGFRVIPGTPLVIASNRDELRARPSDPPLLLNSDPQLYGGRDRWAGGTWLAVDPAGGRVATLTNRHLGGPPGRDPNRHSRGEIALELLRQGDDDGAASILKSLRSADYNPANVIYASPKNAWCLTLDDISGEVLTHLAPGVHVVTVAGCNVTNDGKNRWLGDQARSAAERAKTGPDLLDAWKQLLTVHEPLEGTPQSAVCIHMDVYGTVSSETLLVNDDGVDFRHAEGFPCQQPYEPVSMSHD